MFNNPVLTRKDLIENLEIHRNTVSKHLEMLIENNVIRETTGYSKNQIFIFQEYINYFK